MLKLKQAVRGAINNFGYDIVRKPMESENLFLYDSFNQQSIANKRFYNIGAGDFYHPYWTNVDYATDHYAGAQQKPFINFNLMEIKPLPLESDSAEVVYTSHTIEHINDEAVQNLLNEAYRILKPGGCIRLTTPDAERLYWGYQQQDIEYWIWRHVYSQPGTWEKIYTLPLNQASIHQLIVHYVASQVSAISVDKNAKRKFQDEEIIKVFKENSMNDAFDIFTKQCEFNPLHPGSHMNWWTYEKARSFLLKAGFNTCFKSSYGQSFCPPLRETSLFDNTHPSISLYVEAFKSKADN